MTRGKNARIGRTGLNFVPKIIHQDLFRPTESGQTGLEEIRIGRQSPDQRPAQSQNQRRWSAWRPRPAAAAFPQMDAHVSWVPRLILPQKTRQWWPNTSSIIAVIGFLRCTHGPPRRPQTLGSRATQQPRMGLRLALAQGSDAPTSSARRSASSATRRPRGHLASASGPDRQEPRRPDRPNTHAPLSRHRAPKRRQGAEEVQILVRRVGGDAYVPAQGPAFPLGGPTSGCMCLLPQQHIHFMVAELWRCH